jgi:hypothetical protein
MGRVWRRFKETQIRLFLRPRHSQILFAQSSGILLAVGIELMTDFLTDPGPWRFRHSSGLSFLCASVVVARLAWLAQGFQDFLVNAGKDRPSIDEAKVQLDSWEKEEGETVGREILSAYAVTLLAVGFLLLGRSM